jgi:type IV pilus assembly protein PilW
VITHPMGFRPERKRAFGFTLLELLIGALLAALLTMGLVQIVAATSVAADLQRNNAQLQDHARFAIEVLSRAIREAGYRPEPWNDSWDLDALSDETVDGVSASSDRLAVRTWSDVNCFDNRNPDRDSAGQPRYYLRESVFDLTGNKGLARTCRYGPTVGELTTQVPRQGWVSGVESFQLLFGEDHDGDGNIEQWVGAGQWGDPLRILGIRVGLLLASADAVVEPDMQRFEVLDSVYLSPADGRLRRPFDLAVAIRSRTP